MIRGRVLVIDGDEWTSSVLVRALREKGWTADPCGEAVAGFRKACETPLPECIVLTPELPDIDGAWVARKVRTESGPLSKVPILFVGDVPDRSIRTQILNVGADVFLSRPISNDEVVAQIGALVAMAHRHDGKEEGSPSSISHAAAIRGDLSAFPLASLLMMFEMERRSGLVEVVSSSGRRASLALSAGLFASTEVSGAPRPALEVLREVLSWRAGRFSFQPRESGMLPAPRASVGALVLEAMRLEDEEKSPMPELSADDLVEAVDSRREGHGQPQEGHVARPERAPPPRPKASL